jgi:leader peptidase (prepilin peptidase)/N-methyltransferase
MLAIVAGLFGLIIGSFLNVVILRKGVKGIGGRSGCAQCGHPLAWQDLVPVLSWISLRGRCRYCGSRISAQYPLVELVTALLFAGIFASPLSLGYGYLSVSCIIASLLVCIFVYDLRHTIIPDAWTYSFAAIALGGALFVSSDVYMTLVSGPVAAVPLFLLWAVSGGRWMGFGDVKLALGIGWLLGVIPGVFSIFLAFVLGSITLVPIVVWERFVTHSLSTRGQTTGLTMKSEVPFGPFLVASTLIVWISMLYAFDIAALAGW